MKVEFLGQMPYAQALALMEEKHSQVIADPLHLGFLLVVEHLPTVTMGKRPLWEDMLLSPEELKEKGVDYCKIDRGGSVTVHEPGQVVVYPIVRMETYKLSVRSYVALLEQAMIDVAGHYGVEASRDDCNPGVWVRGIDKIGAVGIRIAQDVTKHGLAFNVNNSLETFEYVIPCGLKGRGVTSLVKEVSLLPENKSPRKVLFAEVEQMLAHRICQALSK